MRVPPLRSRRAAGIGIVVGLAALWGVNYVLIGIAVKELDPAFLSSVRALGGGLALIAWRPRAALGTLALARARPLTMVSLAAVGVTLPLWLLGVAEHHGVSAGATAVVLAFSPVLVAITAPAFDHSERLSGAQWVGALVATAGVAVVVGAAAAKLGSALGLAAILLATATYAAASIVAKLRCEGWPATELAIGTLLVGGLLLAPGAAGTAPHAVPSLEVIVAMVLLAVVGTGGSYVWLYGAIKFGGAGFSLRPVYLSPAFSVVGGAALLGQPVTEGLAVGFLITCLGVALSTREEEPERPA